MPVRKLRLAGVLFALSLALPASSQSLTKQVRAALADDNFDQAARLVEKHKAGHGITSEVLEAQSWLARWALGAGKLEQAESLAANTHREALELLKKRPLDADSQLPIALGAAIEVQAQVLAARGERSTAVAFLKQELENYRGTSIHTRIQKNINLISLEGQPALELDVSQWLGPQPPPLRALKGRPVLLFFWAHWCGDCKWQAPILARLLNDFGPKGLAILGPTQPYGYVSRGQPASRAEEVLYIDQVRQNSYGNLASMPVPVSEENFRIYGASTTPTLVLIDAGGVVSLYHPGQMSYEQLAPRIAELFR